MAGAATASRRTRRASGAPGSRSASGRPFRPSPKRAPANMAIQKAADELVAGMKSGCVRNRSGDLYKPSAIRSYEAALRDHIIPRLGRTRLADVQHRDVQRIADDLLTEGRDPSTIRNALMPLRVIF